MAESAKVYGDTGCPVLLLAGGNVPCEGYFPGIVEGLVEKPGCRVITYNPVVPNSESSSNITVAVENLHKMITALGFGPLVVVGQSLGGALALMLAQSYPDDVAGIVLLDATPIYDTSIVAKTEKQARSLARMSAIPIVGAIFRKTLTRMTRREIERLKLRPDCAEAYRRIMETQLDLPALSKSICGLAELSKAFMEQAMPKKPTAILVAERKKEDPVQVAHQRLADSLGEPLISYPGASHAIHLDHPDETLDAIRGMITRVTRN